jgi:hypothetical protein
MRHPAAVILLSMLCIGCVSARQAVPYDEACVIRHMRQISFPAEHEGGKPHVANVITVSCPDRVLTGEVPLDFFSEASEGECVDVRGVTRDGKLGERVLFGQPCKARPQERQAEGVAL